MPPEERRERRFHLVSAVGRLAAGRSTDTAERELATLYQQLAIEYPDTTAQWTARVLPFRSLLLGDSSRALVVLGGAVSVLVVVAWMNVASLLFAWLPTRRQEFLVRLALGASQGRVLRQLLLETLLWAAAGMAGGLVVAKSFLGLFGAVGISAALPYDFKPSVNGRVVAASAALLLIGVGVAGLAPCVLAVRRSRELVPRRAWKSGGLARRITVGTQVALSIVLLSASAGLMIGFRHLASMTPSSPASATFAVEVARSESPRLDDADHRRFFTQLLSALAIRRELGAVAAASYVPPTPPLGNVRFSIVGRTSSTEGQTALVSAVSATAFRLLGISLVRGRLIDQRDGQDAPRVAVISSALARRYWPDEQAIGQQIILVGTERPITIVGVVADVLQPLSKDPRAASVLYLSYQQAPWPFMTVMFTASGDGPAAVAAVRQEVARIDPAQAAGSVRVLSEMRNEWLTQPRLQTTVIALFGSATLLLTLGGLYARVAHDVTVRAREFAIRQALGARPSDVVRTLTVDAVLVTVGGVLAGLALLPATTQALRSLVAEAPSLNPALIAAVAGGLVLTAAASVYWPARRAGLIEPARLLNVDR